MLMAYFILAPALTALPGLLVRRWLWLALYVVGANLALWFAFVVLTDRVNGPGVIGAGMLFGPLWAGVLSGSLAGALALLWRDVRAQR